MMNALSETQHGIAIEKFNESERYSLPPQKWIKSKYRSLPVQSVVGSWISDSGSSFAIGVDCPLDIGFRSMLDSQ